MPEAEPLCGSFTSTRVKKNKYLCPALSPRLSISWIILALNHSSAIRFLTSFNRVTATKISRLLDACGHDSDPEGFFSELLKQLAKADGTRKSLSTVSNCPI